MLRVALCDDDRFFLDRAAGQMEAILSAEGIACTVEKFTDGIKLLDGGRFDLLFLDIEMVGLDGMRTARALRARGDRCLLVFLSAHPQHVFESFDVEAAHYLVKPVDENKLREVLLRLARKAQQDACRSLVLSSGGVGRRIPFSEILYLEVLDRKVFIHADCAVHDFYGKLDKLEKELPEEFFRCHRSYIVSLARVRRYDRGGITLDSGESIPVSKRKYPEFCHRLMHHLRGEAQG